MIMIAISFVLVKFYAFAILYVLIVMKIKLVVVVVVEAYSRRLKNWPEELCWRRFRFADHERNPFINHFLPFC